MRFILFTILCHLLFSSYEVGETMSIEDQNQSYEVCYGNYPDSEFRFADLNGEINEGIYKISIIRMNATW